MRAIVDTSVFIRRERGTDLDGLPDEAAVSVITLAELHLGVLLAENATARAPRLRTLAEAERGFQALPVDAAVAGQYAQIVAAARRAGHRPRALDVLIAATAAVNEVPVYTRDRDFTVMPGVDVILLD